MRYFCRDDRPQGANCSPGRTSRLVPCSRPAVTRTGHRWCACPRRARRRRAARSGIVPSAGNRLRRQPRSAPLRTRAISLPLVGAVANRSTARASEQPDRAVAPSTLTQLMRPEPGQHRAARLVQRTFRLRIVTVAQRPSEGVGVAPRECQRLGRMVEASRHRYPSTFGVSFYRHSIYPGGCGAEVPIAGAAIPANGGCAKTVLSPGIWPTRQEGLCRPNREGALVQYCAVCTSTTGRDRGDGPRWRAGRNRALAGSGAAARDGRRPPGILAARPPRLAPEPQQS